MYNKKDRFVMSVVINQIGFYFIVIWQVLDILFWKMLELNLKVIDV